MFATQALADLASFGAAGIMGAMWLWERRASRLRDQQLTEAHARIVRDEQRLAKLVEVVEHNTAALTRVCQTQHEIRQTMTDLKEEIRHAQTT
jgi:hypothetical protein